jgi:hypothetical protein
MQLFNQYIYVDGDKIGCHIITVDLAWRNAVKTHTSNPEILTSPLSPFVEIFLSKLLAFSCTTFVVFVKEEV